MGKIKCTLCNQTKPLKEFYKNNRTLSGYANQCKECVKIRSKKREEKLRQNPDWIEKERARSRDKYHRLNYKEKQLEWDKNKPWKSKSSYKNLHRDLKLKNEETAHHWNYNLLKDVFILNKDFHKHLHKYLIFDDNTLCFKTIDGALLDNKVKHWGYLSSIRTIFNNKKLYENN